MLGGEERNVRLVVPNLGGEARGLRRVDVGRIADDQKETAREAHERLEQVAGMEAHAPGETEAVGILLGHREGGVRDVGRVDAGFRQLRSQ